MNQCKNCERPAMYQCEYCRHCWLLVTIECQRKSCTRRALPEKRLCASCVTRGFNQCIQCGEWRVEFAKRMCRECISTHPIECDHINVTLHKGRCVECFASNDHVVSPIDDGSGIGSCSTCGPVAIKIASGGRYCKLWDSFKARAVRYGITTDMLAQLYLATDATCWICHKPEGNDLLSVDHDHDCCDSLPACGSCVRQLLCTNCNTSLGKFEDSPARLRRAAGYIEAFSVTVPA